MGEVTKQNLIAAGYRKHVSDRKYSDALFQKRICAADSRTRYFVNIYQYIDADRCAWTPSVQFQLPSGVSVNIEFIGQQSVEEIEAAFEKAFCDFKAVDYDDQ